MKERNKEERKKGRNERKNGRKEGRKGGDLKGGGRQCEVLASGLLTFSGYSYMGLSLLIRAEGLTFVRAEGITFSPGAPCVEQPHSFHSVSYLVLRLLMRFCDGSQHCLQRPRLQCLVRKRLERGVAGDEDAVSLAVAEECGLSQVRVVLDLVTHRLDPCTGVPEGWVTG